MLLQRFGLPTQLEAKQSQEIGAEDLLASMMHDKKNAYGRLNLILPCRIGQVETVSDAPLQWIEQAIREGFVGV
jgi:3-dehydroquinate synthetase